MRNKIIIEINEIEISKLRKENTSFSLSPLCIKLLHEISFKLNIPKSTLIENLILKEFGLTNQSYFKLLSD